MTKARLLAFPLSLALALAGVSAVMAQDESPAAEMPEVAEYNEDEALIIYGWLREEMLAAGMAAEDIPAAFDALEERYGELDEEDIADLAEYYVASEGISRVTDEIGDGSFGFIGDDDGEDDAEGDNDE